MLQKKVYQLTVIPAKAGNEVTTAVYVGSLAPFACLEKVTGYRPSQV